MKQVLSRRGFLTQLGAVAGVGVAGAVLSACAATPAAPQSATSEVEAAEAAAPAALECRGHVTLGYYTSTTPAIERMKAQEASFHEKAPDVDLEIIQMTSIYDKYATMMAAGNEPNVIWMGTGFWQFVGVGAFLDLNPLFDADMAIDLAEYYPKVLELFTWKDSLFALPYGFTSTVYAYNEDLLAKEGLTAPSDTWTHDDLIAMGQALTKDTDGDGRLDQFGTGNGGFWQCIWEFGADAMDEGYTKSTLDTEEAIAALQYMYDLTFGAYKIAPTPDTLQEIGGFPLFNTGKIGFWQLGRWGVPVLREGAVDINWNVAPAPGQKGSWISGESYAISARTPDKGAAWCLLKHLCDREAQETFYMTEASATPAIKAAAESDAYMDDGKPPVNDKAFVDTLDFAKYMPTHPITLEINNIVNPIVDQMNAGDITPAQAGAMMTEGVDTKLREYEGIWGA